MLCVTSCLLMFYTTLPTVHHEFIIRLWQLWYGKKRHCWGSVMHNDLSIYNSRSSRTVRQETLQHQAPPRYPSLPRASRPHQRRRRLCRETAVVTLLPPMPWSPLSLLLLSSLLASHCPSRTTSAARGASSVLADQQRHNKQHQQQHQQQHQKWRDQ